MAEVLPRTPLVILLALIAILGAVESTPKEVALSVSTSATSASPLNTLPPGTSLLLRDLAEAGYDVRVYADLSDLFFDAPRRVVVAVIGPERVTTTQAQALADYARRAEYVAILLADEDPRESGSLALIERMSGFCDLGRRIPRPSLMDNSTVAILAYGGEASGYGVSVAPVYTVAAIRGLLPPLPEPLAPPLPPVSFTINSYRVRVLAFAESGGEGETEWAPLAMVCKDGRSGFALVGDSDVARNYLYNASDVYRNFTLTLFRELAGDPGDGVTIAFIVSFYVGESLSLATVIHPSYILSLASQLYAAAEPELLASLGGRLPLALTAAALAASLTAAGHLARGVGRPRVPRGRAGRGPRPGREDVAALCRALQPALDPGAAAVCGRLDSRVWRIAYSITGWRRVYNRLLGARR